MRKRKTAALALLPALIFPGCAVSSETTENTIYTEQTAAVDFYNIRPQDDFYGYVNASALNEANIEDNDGNAGAFIYVQNMIDDRINGIIDEIVNGDQSAYAPGSNEQLIFDLYNQVLDASTGGSCMSASDIAYLNDLAQQILNT